MPSVVGSDCSAVFSFDDNGIADAKFTVFLRSESDVRRCERIKVYSVDKKYLWETNKIKKIATGNYQWAGNANFVVPQGEKIPVGRYEITYVNADQEQVVSYSDMIIDETLYNMKSEDVAGYMKDKGVLNFAIFNSDNVLLFLGEPREDFSTKADMLDKYNDASYYREVWVTFDNSVICILPKNQL